MIALYYEHYFDSHCLYFENVSNGCDYCVVWTISRGVLLSHCLKHFGTFSFTKVLLIWRKNTITMPF